MGRQLKDCFKMAVIGVLCITLLEIIALLKNIDGRSLVASGSGIVGIISFYFGKWKGHKEAKE